MKKSICLTIIITLIILFTACNKENLLDEASISLEVTNPVVSEKNDNMNPYLSIVARRENHDFEEFVWDQVYYTYDLVTGELQEICVLPHVSGYTSGVVSLSEKAVYFSMKKDWGSNDQLCRYDIQSDEIIFLENKNFSFNDMTIIDPGTLLMIAVNNTITPALYDLQNDKFIYMPEVNNEPFDLYTTGGQLMNYNYLFDTFPWLYFKEDDRYSDGYTSHEEAIDYNIVMVQTDLKKSSDIYTTQFTADYQISFLTQVSENTVLMRLFKTTIDESILDFIHEESYYYLTFDDGNSLLTHIDNPFPNAVVAQALTFDGGKTYYCRGYYTDDNENMLGDSLFIYDCETHEITPILTGGDGIIGVANFRVVNPLAPKVKMPLLSNESTIDNTQEEPPILSENDFEYELNDSGVTITRYIGRAVDVVIPREINGYPVIFIGEGAFARNHFLKSVVIADSVTDIGEWAFENSTELNRVVIPDSVISIGKGAFSRCSNLTDVSLPNGITVIEWSVFMHCHSLPYIIIPDSVIIIEGHAFAYCESLTEIFIPENVTFIGERAFYSNDYLTNVTISSEETEIDPTAFYRTPYDSN